MKKLTSATAISMILAATPALAEVTPKSVWENLNSYYARYGLTVESASVDEAGDTLTVNDLVLSQNSDGAKTRAQFEFLPRAKCPKLQAGLSSRLLPPATPAAPRLQIHPAPDSEKLASWRMAGQPDPTERNRR